MEKKCLKQQHIIRLTKYTYSIAGKKAKTSPSYCNGVPLMHSSTLFIFKQKPLQRNANEANQKLYKKSIIGKEMTPVVVKFEKYQKEQTHQTSISQ